MRRGRDVLSKSSAYLKLFASSEFSFEPEQEVAVRALVDGKDVLAVLPTGYPVVMARASSISNVRSRTMNWMVR